MFRHQPKPTPNLSLFTKNMNRAYRKPKLTHSKPKPFNLKYEPTPPQTWTYPIENINRPYLEGGGSHLSGRVGCPICTPKFTFWVGYTHPLGWYPPTPRGGGAIPFAYPQFMFWVGKPVYGVVVSVVDPPWLANLDFNKSYMVSAPDTPAFAAASKLR